MKALKDPQTVKLIEAQAIQVVGNSPQAFADFIKQDIVLWKDVAQRGEGGGEVIYGVS